VDKLCLRNGRFRVTVEQKDSPSATYEKATKVKLTDETGYFWFYSSGNVEVVIKVLDGCGINSRYWVFIAGLTNVGVRVRVYDLEAGQAKTFTNTYGTTFQAVTDTSAFATCP
jgi:hypothetical protein